MTAHPFTPFSGLNTEGKISCGRRHGALQEDSCPWLLVNKICNEKRMFQYF